jgi:hypothetical protein
MQRPWSVTLIGVLFILSGTIGIIYHAPELTDVFSNSSIILVFVIRALAIVGGVFALRAANWARWLLVEWMAYHVVLSFYHDLAQIITHAIFLVLILAGLFHQKANSFFKR